MAHATFSLCPKVGTGLPGKNAPLIAHSGVRTCIRYHGAGSVGARCGSHARIARPVAVRDGAIAHAFDAPPSDTTLPTAATSVASRSAARRALALAVSADIPP